MSVMKLVEVAVKTLTFDPDMGYSFPDILEAKHHRTKSGKLFSFKFYHKRKWSVPISWFDSTDATSIYTWWTALTQLEFYPDLVNAPATKYNVRLVNRIRPLNKFIGPNFETKFQGKLEIEEI